MRKAIRNEFHLITRTSPLLSLSKNFPRTSPFVFSNSISRCFSDETPKGFEKFKKEPKQQKDLNEKEREKGESSGTQRKEGVQKTEEEGPLGDEEKEAKRENQKPNEAKEESERKEEEQKTETPKASGLKSGLDRLFGENDNREPKSKSIPLYIASLAFLGGFIVFLARNEGSENFERITFQVNPSSSVKLQAVRKI